MDRYRENHGKFKQGTRYIGNISRTESVILKIENPDVYGTETGVPMKEGEQAYIMDLETGNRYSYGLKALEHCDVTILN